MISCCANPSCRVEFRFLNGGDLYALERELENTQFFWVCPACSRYLVLELDLDGSVSAEIRSRTNRAPHPPRPTSYLKLVYRQAPSTGRSEGEALFEMDKSDPRSYSTTIHARTA
jgi:hypothetical protein